MKHYGWQDFLLDFLKLLGVIAAASGIGILFFRIGLSDANIVMVYLLGVLVAAIWTNGRFYSIMAAFFSVVIFNFLFTEPRFTLFAYDADYPVTFLVMMISGMLTGSLARGIKLQARQAAYKAYRSSVLLETSKLLQTAADESEILQHTARQLFRLLERPVFFLNREGERLIPVYIYPPEENDLLLYASRQELEVAAWASAHNQHAGASTPQFSNAQNLYLSVHGKSGVLAVAGFAAKDYPKLEHFDKNLMLTILDECGLALEKERLVREKQQAELAVQKESLRANLLRSVSHDLRTPLTSILGNLDILMENEQLLDAAKRQELYAEIYDDSIWLLNLVENLLSVTRLENGTMQLKLEPELIDDVFHDAMSHFDRRAKRHQIRMELPDDLLMAKMDGRLILQVIVNLVNNAVKYTPDNSRIVLSAKKRPDRKIEVSVTDDGPGIPESAKEHLFTMFYTANTRRSDGRRGMGLGLFLCKSIVTAHDGALWLTDNTPHGCIFSFTLPAVEVTGDDL